MVFYQVPLASKSALRMMISSFGSRLYQPVNHHQHQLFSLSITVSTPPAHRNNSTTQYDIAGVSLLLAERAVLLVLLLLAAEIDNKPLLAYALHVSMRGDAFDNIFLRLVYTHIACHSEAQNQNRLSIYIYIFTTKRYINKIFPQRVVKKSR